MRHLLLPKSAQVIEAATDSGPCDTTHRHACALVLAGLAVRVPLHGQAPVGHLDLLLRHLWPTDSAQRVQHSSQPASSHSAWSSRRLPKRHRPENMQHPSYAPHCRLPCVTTALAARSLQRGVSSGRCPAPSTTQLAAADMSVRAPAFLHNPLPPQTSCALPVQMR